MCAHNVLFLDNTCCMNHANVDISHATTSYYTSGATSSAWVQEVIFCVRASMMQEGGIKVNLYKVQIFIAVLSLQWRNSCLQNAQRQWNLVYPSKVGMFHAWKYTHALLTAHTNILLLAIAVIHLCIYTKQLPSIRLFHCMYFSTNHLHTVACVNRLVYFQKKTTLL